MVEVSVETKIYKKLYIKSLHTCIDTNTHIEYTFVNTESCTNVSKGVITTRIYNPHLAAADVATGRRAGGADGRRVQDRGAYPDGEGCGGGDDGGGGDGGGGGGGGDCAIIVIN